jgi:hypothetical protein
MIEVNDERLAGAPALDIRRPTCLHNDLTVLIAARRPLVAVGKRDQRGWLERVRQVERAELAGGDLGDEEVAAPIALGGGDSALVVGRPPLPRGRALR